MELDFRKIQRDWLDRAFQLTLDCYGDSLLSFLVFGSMARGETTADSDIDLFLVIEDESPTVSGAQRREIFRKRVTSHFFEEGIALNLRGIFPRLSPVIFYRSELSIGTFLFLEFVDHGKMLLDREQVLGKRLDLVIGRMFNYGTKKCDSPYGYYWDIKPGILPGEIIEI